MSNLLFDESPLIVQPTLATRIGLNEAIALQQLHYWLKPERKPHMIDGIPWIYNSSTEWTKQFPFWSRATTQRAFANLEKMHLVRTANFNKLGFDRTKWYTIDYVRVREVETSEQCIAQNEQSSDANCAMDDSKLSNASTQNEPTIPESTTEISSEISIEEDAPEIPEREKALALLRMEFHLPARDDNLDRRFAALWIEVPIYEMHRKSIYGLLSQKKRRFDFADYETTVRRISQRYQAGMVIGASP